MTQETITYDDAIVRKFALASMIWGFIGMLAGLWLAFELASYKFNLDLEWLSFGRIRPLHTNAVIFAFVGNGMFAGMYYSTQRLLKARMASDALSKFHFWGWQGIVVAAAVTLPLGITTSKEYAELKWLIDIAIAVVWVALGINFLLTMLRRREKHLYVAIWFYIASIVAVAMLHVVNSFAVPVTLLKSYSVYAGAHDGLVQWWYGRNAVAFFLTTPYLGLMYYFMPKAAQRPVYSYRLSIIHFWALVFLYIWAGPHHLLNNSLSHYTNWTIAHVHAGALGWNGLFTFGMFYWLFPRLWNTKLHSEKAANAHFWLSLVGIGAYVFSMWAAGVSEGLMWKEFNADGKLVYGTWDEMMPSLNPMYWIRAIGGTIYLAGVVVMGWNLYKTYQNRGVIADTSAEVPARVIIYDKDSDSKIPWHTRLEGRPLAFTLWTTVAAAIGGIFELVPSMTIRDNIPTIAAVPPYSPLELEGRDIYIAEGCVSCHSQMVRPFRDETIRYGEYSKAGEFVYDRPFLWGSRRIGPDLQRVGGKYPHLWHYNHMINPRDISPKSLMPNYGHLPEQKYDVEGIAAKMATLQSLGTPSVILK